MENKQPKCPYCNENMNYACNQRKRYYVANNSSKDLAEIDLGYEYIPFYEAHFKCNACGATSPVAVMVPGALDDNTAKKIVFDIAYTKAMRMSNKTREVSDEHTEHNA